MNRIRLVSVNVAQPEVIGERRGKSVLSGIRKRPVTSERVVIGSTNLGGDAQADLRVHGGPDKAVYAYPSEHAPWWTEQLRPATPFGPGSFGENLTTAGALETHVCIGDQWRWGSAVLQVCQPRYPCFKLVMATGQSDMVTRFLEAGRSGWYLRVLTTGEATTHDDIEVVDHDNAGVTIFEASRAVLPGADPALVARVQLATALAASWRSMLREEAA